MAGGLAGCGWKILFGCHEFFDPAREFENFDLRLSGVLRRH